MPAQTHLPTDTQVLIVGAGPVGLTLAIALAIQGVDAVLVDKQAAGANTSRAAVIHARTLEVLEDIAVSHDLVRRGVIVPRFTVRDRDRALLTVDFNNLPTAYPYTLMIPQNITEQVLLERLNSHGQQVHRPYEVADVTQDAAGATVTMTTGEVVKAAYVVGADGVHSTVRASAGIGFTGDTYAQSFVLADVHMDWYLSSDEVMLYFSPAGLLVVAPLPEGQHRIVAIMDDATAHPHRDDVQSLLDTRGPVAQPALVQDVVWSSRFRIHHRLADHYRAGRLLLAGDAAHTHSPAGGQGMNIGMQDAMTLAALLTEVLRDNGPESTLDAYEAQRRPIAEQVVSFTHRMTRVATLDHVPLRVTRNAVLRTLGLLPPVRQKLAMNLAELATHPRARSKQPTLDE